MEGYCSYLQLLPLFCLPFPFSNSFIFFSMFFFSYSFFSFSSLRFLFSSSSTFSFIFLLSQHFFFISFLNFTPLNLSSFLSSSTSYQLLSLNSPSVNVNADVNIKFHENRSSGMNVIKCTSSTKGTRLHHRQLVT
jgi:hypothetical protein